MAKVNTFTQLYVVIMSRTSFRVNPHSIVCLNVREVLARSRGHIWSLSDSNVIRTHNHLVRKWTLNYLAKLAKLWLSGWVFVYELSGCGFESRFCHFHQTFHLVITVVQITWSTLRTNKGKLSKYLLINL